MPAWLSDPATWIALVSLVVLEIILGIDNVVFISILTGKLPPEQRQKAMRIGLGLAMLTRIGLLFGISWVLSLEEALFTVAGQKISGRDLILLAGGLFLLWKAVKEIHDKLEGHAHGKQADYSVAFAAVIGQILVIDLVFSLDSVITAVAMTEHIEIMIGAVVISILFMLLYAGPVASFVERHPTVKMLALSFLILIAVNLIAEAFHHEIPRGYTYFAMAFSVGVEMLNLKLRKGDPVHLNAPTPKT